MTLSKPKIFRDPIYGYVDIPHDFCVDFIDTDIFQRLRRIEQTSMRGLYPAAHHDRFAHSIGVFYLGTLAFGYLYNNSKDNFPSITTDEWNCFRQTFSIACLLHDCGHSPFSHTFEHYYLYNREKEIKDQILAFYAEEKDFSSDFDTASAAPHEKISALILLSKYYDAVEKNGGDPLLAARMIMGCKYETTNGNELLKFKNRLISLLNGVGIDVDSLDYIQRDSWASGVSNVNIDYQRLFSSIMIKNDSNGIPQIVFKKHVLSALENISIGRNFLYKWIYSHHKVTYEQYLLKGIVDEINRGSNDEFCKKIFSVESFSNPQKFENYSFFLPTDDDLIYVIKQYYSSNCKVQEFFSRKHKYKAIWKTYFEFNDAYFENVSGKNKMTIFGKINKGELESVYGDDILCLKAEPKLKGLNSNDFFIDINGKLTDASKANSIPTENLSYFLIYVSEKLSGKEKDVYQKLISLQS